MFGDDVFGVDQLSDFEVSKGDVPRCLVDRRVARDGDGCFVVDFHDRALVLWYAEVGTQVAEVDRFERSGAQTDKLGLHC